MTTKLRAVEIGREFKILLGQMFTVKRDGKNTVAFASNYKQFKLLSKENDCYVVSAIQLSFFNEKPLKDPVVLHIANESYNTNVELI